MNRFLFLSLIYGSLFASEKLDTFGIRQFYHTKVGYREWNSAHWNNGISRTIKYASDTCDPTDWTEDHSSGTDGFNINGAGIMEMSGSGPRFHINSLRTTKVPTQQFRNIEFTAYYSRKGNAGQNYAGMVVGLRSGPLGHGSSGGNDCDATTYYGRFRNDGKWDFEKELKHPGSSYWSGSGYNKQDPLWKGAALPQNRWIGMKYLCYNIQNNTKVKLELYIDSVSNGNPQGGGHWEKVGEVIDEGNWPSGDVSGCNYQNTKIILDGNGTILLRTDNDTAGYTMVSIREIVVSETRAMAASPQCDFFPNHLCAYKKTSEGVTIKFAGLHRQVTSLNIFDMQGRCYWQKSIFSSMQTIFLPTGIYLFQFNEKTNKSIVRIAVP
jgi:hypothetical protein